ncbi:hypothetical protein AVEN_53305-1 [Araneus ventricosus]|uniref:Reverse transcriptase domain-containing protein n=1 Tax=Araneus ventricosus TaxID=182803 RepID=A0A4Y2AB63_ARAVE|nr:hypothetical protein AVEN_53305-1 [Araneus ventricosus]
MESATRLPPRLLHRTCFLEPGGRRSAPARLVTRGAPAGIFVFLVNAGSKQEVKNLANKALQTFKTWTDKHKLEISLDKTYYLHINKNRSGPIWYSGIKWGQNNIKRASVIKYLGVLIDDKFNLTAHLSAIKNKSLILHQGLKNVAGTSWGLSKNIRRQLYLTRWWKRPFSMPQQQGPHNITARQQKLLSSIQRKFLLNITGAYNTTPNGGCPGHRRSNASSH